MKITWGKPTIEFAKTVTGGTEPASFETMPTQQEGTVVLSTTVPTADELFGEGHELVARRAKRPTYVLVMNVFIEAGDVRPIETDEGIISDNYAVKLTPEDDTLDGFIFKSSQVDAEETWSSAEGTIIRYTFTALKPELGNIFTVGSTW